MTRVSLALCASVCDHFLLIHSPPAAAEADEDNIEAILKGDSLPDDDALAAIQIVSEVSRPRPPLCLVSVEAGGSLRVLSRVEFAK